MHTRQDYLSRKVTHAEYYGQFITAEIMAIVAKVIGLDEIRKSQESYSNDMDLRKWDSACYAISWAITEAVRATGHTRPKSKGTKLAILKEAARRLLEGTTNNPV